MKSELLQAMHSSEQHSMILLLAVMMRYTYICYCIDNLSYLFKHKIIISVAACAKILVSGQLKLYFVLVQLNLTAGEAVEIEYEVDGWFYVSYPGPEKLNRVSVYKCYSNFCDLCKTSLSASYLGRMIIYLFIYSCVTEISVIWCNPVV